MIRIFTFFLGIALVVSAETNAARGKRVVDASVAALGGDNFLAMEDRIEDGRAYSFYRDRLTGLAKAKIYTRYLKSAGTGDIAQREREMFGKDEDYGILFLEDKGYEVTFRGAKPITQERWDRYSISTRNNILYLLRTRLKESGLIFESRGAEVWQNTPVEIVDITDANNNVVTVYFHASTKLPIRQTWTVRDPKTKEKNDYSVLFSKYRDVGNGIQWPFNYMTERNGEKVFEMFAESVNVNKGLTDDTFVLSSKVRILPADR